MKDFSKLMVGKKLSDVACCPNGYKLVVDGRHIKLTPHKTDLTTQCTATGEQFTTYSQFPNGSGYSVYRTNGGWVLQNGKNWTMHKGGEDCCPRDGAMINFSSAACTLDDQGKCSYPEGVNAQIECA